MARQADHRGVISHHGVAYYLAHHPPNRFYDLYFDRVGADAFVLHFIHGIHRARFGKEKRKLII